MAEEKKNDGLPSLNLKGPEKKESTTKAGGALLARVPKVTPSASPSSGLLGRFRGMAKKDMGLMAAAGALMAALPVAENFIMKPDKGVAPSKAGELFEPNGTVSFGSPNGEMVTPLTARDPLSLILSGEDAENSPVPASPDAASSGESGGGASDGFRESVREPFQRAVERARAAVPTPKSLSFGGGPSIGGGGGSTSAGGISAAARSAPSSPADRGMSGAYAPGLRGFGRSVGNYSGVEAMKGQGDDIASRMNRGSAITAVAGFGGDLSDAPSGGPGRPAAPEDNNQSNQEGDKYKLQPPKPKKPSGGSPMQPWYKEMKEMEAKGEIDRAAALQKFNHEARMEYNKWLRESISNALDTALVNPLKEYIAAKIKQKYAGGGEEEPGDDGGGEIPAPPGGSVDMGSGDSNKEAYEGSYDEASSGVKDCLASKPTATGTVPPVCDKAKASVTKAAENIAAAKDDYLADHENLSKEYDDLSKKIGDGKAAYHTASLTRNQDLNNAESALASVAKDTAVLEASCKGKIDGACAVYQSLNPKGLLHAVTVLRGYEGAVGRVYDDADTVVQSMKNVKKESGDLLTDGGDAVDSVKGALGEMTGLTPEEYSKKLEEQLKKLGPYEKTEPDTVYDLINKGSGDSDAEDAETDYWKTIQPYDWLTEAGTALNDPERASMAITAKPKTYKDAEDRPSSLYRMKAMVANSKKLPNSLDSVVGQLDKQITRVKDQAAQVPKIYKSSPEIQAILH